VCESNQIAQNSMVWGLRNVHGSLFPSLPFPYLNSFSFLPFTFLTFFFSFIFLTSLIFLFLSFSYRASLPLLSFPLLILPFSLLHLPRLSFSFSLLFILLFFLQHILNLDGNEGSLGLRFLVAQVRGERTQCNVM
jgi:hypothetical protein